MSPLATAPAALTAADGDRRAAYLAEVLRTLYPGGPAAGGEEYLVLPHPRRPRLLVPAGARRAAATAVRYGGEPGSWQARLLRTTVATALRAGGGGLLAARVRVETAGSVAPHLRELLGAPVHLGIHIGPARANRKPVLQLLSPAGEMVGYAKLGTGPLTDALVRAETAALTALAYRPLAQLTVPQVRHAGRWGGHPLLVQSAVPVWRPRAALRPERLALAMRELASCLGTSSEPLATSRYWRQLRLRLGVVAGTPEGAALAGAADRLVARAGGLELRYGACHGDWSPWNMAVLADTLLVWDWERFRVGVPLGFDALHYDLQYRLQSTPDAAGAVTATLTAAGALLAPFHVPPPARRTTALLYLVDLAARYLADGQAEAGARLGVLGRWLLPVLVAAVSEVHP